MSSKPTGTAPAAGDQSVTMRVVAAPACAVAFGRFSCMRHCVPRSPRSVVTVAAS